MECVELTRGFQTALRAAIVSTLTAAAAIGVATGKAEAGDATAPVQLAYAVPGPSFTPAFSSYPTPFARTAFRTVNAELFPKWHGTLARTALQLDGVDITAVSAERSAQARSAFNRIVEQVAIKSGLDQLTTANSLINAVPYRTDQEVYGVSDYWATPIELLAANGGDCEDHAIAKLAVLKQAGVHEDKLRLVVGIDTKTGKAHAMAVVEVDGTAYALDGRTDRIIAWDNGDLRFKPLYAAGFHKAWIYRS